MYIARSCLAAVVACLAAAFVVVVAEGCAGPAANDLTAAEHSEKAATEEEKADVHLDKYDAEAVAVRPRGQVKGPQAGNFFPVEIYNPTDRQLHAAARHEKVAVAHEKAATLLSTFDEGVCGELPPTTRALCPLLAQVKTVTDIDRGVLVVPDDGVDLDAWAVHIQCDLVFAKSARSIGIDECPLFAHGVSATVVDHGVQLVLDAPLATPKAVALLRTAARTHI